MVRSPAFRRWGGPRITPRSESPAAISRTLAELQKNIPSKSRRSCLKSQMEQLPANADFKALESLLPAVDVNKNEDPVNVSRSVLFEKWAAADPAGAANHIIENPSRFNPRLSHPIADVVLRNDPAVGWDWAQEFPDGPYFDTAASIAIDYMREFHPDQAKRLAEMIGDPQMSQMRKRAIARAGAPLTRIALSFIDIHHNYTSNPKLQPKWLDL